MGILIDASILVDYERGRLDVTGHVAARGTDELFLSVITASELLHSVHRATGRVQRAKRSAFVEGVLDRFALLPIYVPAARTHAQIWAELAAKGQMIGALDLWLAAVCVAHGFALATSNLREFSRVPGLVVEDWSRPPAGT